MHGLEKEYAGRVDFVRVNVLDPASEPLMKRFSFSATPELYLLAPSGKVIGFWDGDVAADDLRAAFDAALP